MSANQNNTGAGQLSANAKVAAANLGPAAIQLASGAGVLRTASDTLKGAALDRLLGPTALFAGGLIGALRTMKAIVDQSGLLERGMRRIASIQQIEGRFETMLKSAEKATARIKELYKFTATSPFDFSDVAEANRILQALTKGALAGARGMKMVGDVAAATGQSMSEVAEKVGKLYNALRSGRSIDKVLFQLQGMGAVTDQLASQLETASAAGAGFADTWKIVENSLMSAEGGMKNEMKTLDAMNKKLVEASRLMETAFAEPFTDAQAKSIEATVKATQNLTPVLARIGKDIAPLLTFFSGVKNELTVATIATKGFADALMFAWSALSAIFKGVAITSIVSMGSNFFKVARSVTSFASNLLKTNRIVNEYSRAMGEMRRSTLLAAAANKAFDQGNVINGVKLKAMALQASLTAKAVNLHRTAKINSKTEGGGTSIMGYAGSMAGGLAIGAMGMARKGLGALGLFMKANPVLLIGTVAAAGEELFEKWAEKTAAANKEQMDFIFGLSSIREEARKSVDGVKTLDQYREAATLLEEKLADVNEQLKNLSPADPEFASKLGEIVRTRRMLSGQRAILRKRDISGVGLSEKERSNIVEDTQKRLQVREALQEATAARGDDYTRRGFLASESARLAQEAKIGRENAEGVDSPERFKNNPTALMRMNAAIASMEKNGGSATKGMYERRAELANLAATHQDKIIQKAGVDTELQALDNKIQLQEVELAYDKEIAAIKIRGGETATMEMSKQLAILRKQLELARVQGRKGDAASIEAQIAGLAGDQAKFRAGVAVDRAANNATINKNSKAAQAIRDADEIRKLQDQYQANGMDPAQAQADWSRSIMAQAAQAAPRIVSDSSQSVGGGGGSFGSNPILAAQQRVQRAIEAGNNLLEIIARNTAEGGTVK